MILWRKIQEKEPFLVSKWCEKYLLDIFPSEIECSLNNLSLPGKSRDQILLLLLIFNDIDSRVAEALKNQKPIGEYTFHGDCLRVFDSEDLSRIYYKYRSAFLKKKDDYHL